jgi:hypothetical protein
MARDMLVTSAKKPSSGEREEIRTSQPIGDLRVLDHSSSSFQSRFDTSARSLFL